ncbi:uncharacterized protein LOC141711720 isoform X2 [Apium graveolens]|uniref:uncharacterized protein LOC141711720 isoform X2 n=1 Tax=Apium graveolens TaxID=4045 RepID=UPI003D78F92C
MILTGKLIYGVALKPLLFTPWVKSNGVMMCLKVRNFGSSIPVRYIPMNSPKPRIPIVPNSPKYDFEEQNKHTCLDLNVGRTESLNSKGVSERRFAPKKPPKPENSINLVAPVNDFDEHGSLESDGLGLESVDGGKILTRSFGSLDLNDETVDEELGDFQRLEDTEELVHEITGKKASGKPAYQSSKSNQDAENMAAGCLSRRALTTVELRKKLIAKKYPLQVVDEVITKFQMRWVANVNYKFLCIWPPTFDRQGRGRKFLDDFQYAEAFSRSRFSSLSWGPGRIKQALRQKGVSEADAEKAIKLVFKDGECGEDQSRIGLSKSSLDQLFGQASKRWLQSESQPVEKRKSKIVQWLRYRGFNWGVVNVVLKKLESEFPP